MLISIFCDYTHINQAASSSIGISMSTRLHTKCYCILLSISITKQVFRKNASLTRDLQVTRFIYVAIYFVSYTFTGKNNSNVVPVKISAELRPASVFYMRLKMIPVNISVACDKRNK